MSLSDNRPRGTSDLLPVSERKTQPVPIIRLWPPERQTGRPQSTTTVLPPRKPETTPSLPIRPPFPRPAEALPNSERTCTELVPLLTSTLPALPKTPEKRVPMVIKGEMRRAQVLSPDKSKRYRLLVHLGGLALLLVIMGAALFSASPLSRDLGWNMRTPGFEGSLVKNPANLPNSVVAQATATAVYHHQNDGYDPYYNDGQIHTNGLNSLTWPTGECTYWANYEYHLLTGYWVSWSGNADQWVAGAGGAGWNVSQSPHVPAIIVLMPYTQRASSYGHVAVVTKILNSTTVQTSNMNWYADGGGFDRVSTVNFTTGPGIYFIWHA